MAVKPCDPNVQTKDGPRLSRQCEEILGLLRLRPHTNRELANIALKYTSRISDCRKAGYEIAADRLEGGLVRYTLLGRKPKEPGMLFDL